MNTIPVSAVTPGGVWCNTHQQRVDRLASSLHKHPLVQAARDTAEARFRACAEYAVADAPATLDAAVDNLLFSCLQIAINRDPTRPGVVWTVRAGYMLDALQIPDSRHGGDNPDRVYRLAGVSPEYHYRIEGRRHPTHPSAGALYFEAVRAPGLYGQPLLGLHGHDIDIAPDGRFSFTADATPAAGRRNHLQLPPGTENIVIRDTLMDWAQQLPNEVSITCLDGPAAPLRDHDQLANDAVTLYQACVERQLGFLQFCCREQPANQLIVFERPVHWGMGGGLFGINRFELADDQALVVTIDLLGAQAFNIGACDPWATSVDYTRHISCLNHQQAQANHDGSYSFVLAPHDPGVHNWLDTGGLRTGTLCARWDARPAVPLSEVGSDPDYGSSRVFAPERIVPAAVPDCRVVPLTEARYAIREGQRLINREQRLTMHARRAAEHRGRISGVVLA